MLHYVTCRTMDGREYATGMPPHVSVSGWVGDAQIYTEEQADAVVALLNTWRQQAQSGAAWDNAPHGVEKVEAPRQRVLRVLAAAGLDARWCGEEYRVTLPAKLVPTAGRREAIAYYTADSEDALRTGLAMLETHRQHGDRHA